MVLTCQIHTMPLHLYNTLTKRKEKFVPLERGQVGMYVCGPTVYDRPHIGNARSIVAYDLLYRILLRVYGAQNVRYVCNITDVDDKINDKAKELGVTIRSLTTDITKLFHEDVAYLHCFRPNIEPKATEHIAEMQSIITKLLDKSHAYIANSHVYFDVTSDKNYGALAGRNLEEMIAGSRVEVEEHKRHPGDFVLWKPADEEDDISSVFESPWGPGRPGWHIECSAMSSKYLGNDFDIHGGGADLMFPHHTNEISQSCCAFPESKFARYWVHNGFVTVGGEKMSKSLGNFITVNDLRVRGVRGEAIRYLLMSTHYRKPLDFSDKALYDATESLNYIYRACDGIDIDDTCDVDDEFFRYLLDDMNISKALSYLHAQARELNKTHDINTKQRVASAIKSCAKFLGFCNMSSSEWFGEIIENSQLNDLIEERALAKQTKDWKTADTIRDKIHDMGYAIEDYPDGRTSVKRK